MASIVSRNVATARITRHVTRRRGRVQTDARPATTALCVKMVGFNVIKWYFIKCCKVDLK